MVNKRSENEITIMYKPAEYAILRSRSVNLIVCSLLLLNLYTRKKPKKILTKKFILIRYIDFALDAPIMYKTSEIFMMYEKYVKKFS